MNMGLIKKFIGIFFIAVLCIALGLSVEWGRSENISLAAFAFSKF